MKISKLFHWLYASIMLMPIFAIGVKSLYITFNPNAKDSYSGSQEFNYYEKVDTLLPSVKDNDGTLHIDNVYYCDDALSSNDLNSQTLSCLILNGTISLGQISGYDITYFNEFNNFNNTVVNLYFSGNTPVIELSLSGEYDGIDIQFDGYENDTIQFTDCTFILQSQYIDNGFIFETTYYETSYVERTIEQSTLDNAFYYAVDEISQNPLFSWSNSSFLNQPILYITGLFGLPNSSPIITLFSFWLNVSIIWLVYDLIMYVPLLVHRWLDKGVIE